MSDRVFHLTPEEALRAATGLVKELWPYTEDEAREMAQGVSLDWTRRRILEDIDVLDWLMTGRSRSCHYGDHDTEPYDISWRTP